MPWQCLPRPAYDDIVELFAAVMRFPPQKISVYIVRLPLKLRVVSPPVWPPGGQRRVRRANGSLPASGHGVDPVLARQQRH